MAYHCNYELRSYLLLKLIYNIRAIIKVDVSPLHMSYQIEIIEGILLAILTFYVIFLRTSNHIIKKALDDAVHKKSEIGNFLSIFSKNIKTVEEIEDSMNMTARYVADLVSASSLCIFILEEDDTLKASGISGAFPPLHKSNDYILTKPRYILESLRREKIKLGEGIIGEVAKNRESVFLKNASDDPRISSVESVVPIETLMAVPMIREGKVTGVICAVNNRKEGHPFSPEQFSTFKFMATQVVLAYNIVNVYSSLSKQQRISQELDFAKQLQASLLPKEFPEREQFSVHAFYRSAKEVGGDFYDFIEIDRDRLLFVVGDACGKGIPACMLMAMTRSFIRSNARRFTTLSDMMKELNSNLHRDTSDGRFVTMACCLIDHKENILEYARAGHTELLVKTPEHKPRRIYPVGTALGLMSADLAGDYETFSFSCIPKMTLLFYTDGITEALNAKDEEFGIKRLGEAFTSSCDMDNSPQETIEKILRVLDQFTGETQQADDQTLVIIKHR